MERRPMGMCKFVLLWAALLLSALAASAQTWYKVATEVTAATVKLPAGATYRLGSGTCWSASQTVAVATILSLQWPGKYPFADPCPNVLKELDILETSAAQLVILTTGSSNTTRSEERRVGKECTS